jgi:hypothetical protein
VLRKIEKLKKPDLILMYVGLAGSLDGIETGTAGTAAFFCSPDLSYPLSL